MVAGFARTVSEWSGLFPFWGAMIALAAVEMWYPLLDRADEPRGAHRRQCRMGMINAGLTLALPVSTVLSAGWAARHQIGLMNMIAAPAAGRSSRPCCFEASPPTASTVSRTLSVAVAGAPGPSQRHEDGPLDRLQEPPARPRHRRAAARACDDRARPAGLDADRATRPSRSIFALWTHANVRLPDRLDHAPADDAGDARHALRPPHRPARGV